MKYIFAFITGGLIMIAIKYDLTFLGLAAICAFATLDSILESNKS